MASFNFTVDRLYRATAPLTFTADLFGESVPIAPGDQLVYRGLVEIDGVNHYVFETDRRLSTRERTTLDALEENTEEGIQIR
ncbi:MAG TPA: hypothetical protein V6D47_16575 [Oscillatoriaceae cyanobacterium]